MDVVDKLYVIVDQSGNYVSFGSKVAWKTAGAAKNAFRCHVSKYNPDKGYPEKVSIEDTDYKVVEIHSKGEQLG
jgi:hypothetical protein